jgi:hypothetical protein
VVAGSRHSPSEAGHKGDVFRTGSHSACRTAALRGRHRMPRSPCGQESCRGRR